MRTKVHLRGQKETERHTWCDMEKQFQRQGGTDVKLCWAQQGWREGDPETETNGTSPRAREPPEMAEM